MNRFVNERFSDHICFWLVVLSIVAFCTNNVSHGLYLAILANTLKHHWFK